MRDCRDARVLCVRQAGGEPRAADACRAPRTRPNAVPFRLACAEFSKIAQATSVGFAIMGFIGFFVKLIFIPINNIIVGMS